MIPLLQQKKQFVRLFLLVTFLPFLPCSSTSFFLLVSHYYDFCSSTPTTSNCTSSDTSTNSLQSRSIVHTPQCSVLVYTAHSTSALVLVQSSSKPISYTEYFSTVHTTPRLLQHTHKTTSARLRLQYLVLLQVVHTTVTVAATTKHPSRHYQHFMIC